VLVVVVVVMVMVMVMVMIMMMMMMMINNYNFFYYHIIILGKMSTFVLLLSIMVIIHASLSPTSSSVKKPRPDDLLNHGVLMTSISLINDNVTLLNKAVIYVNGHQQPSSYKKFTPQSRTSLTFNYTGAMQSFIVPSGVNYLDVLVWGGGGGSYVNKSAYAGYGLLLSAHIPITSGTICYLYVGGQGMGYDWPRNFTPPFMGGFNGGGNGNSAYGYAGGGASDIRIGGNTMQDRVVVAGGGILKCIVSCGVLLL
jgi:hypothetical protein